MQKWAFLTTFAFESEKMASQMQICIWRSLRNLHIDGVKFFLTDSQSTHHFFLANNL